MESAYVMGQSSPQGIFLVCLCQLSGGLDPACGLFLSGLRTASHSWARPPLLLGHRLRPCRIDRRDDRSIERYSRPTETPTSGKRDHPLYLGFHPPPYRSLLVHQLAICSAILISHAQSGCRDTPQRVLLLTERWADRPGHRLDVPGLRHCLHLHC